MKKAKKYRVLLVTGILVAITTILLFVFCPTGFCIDEYAMQVERYNERNEGIYVSPINSKPEALIEAIKLFENRYTLDEFAYSVSYDHTNDCWLVQGKVWLHYRSCGGAAGGIDNVIIRSDGTVLAIWVER